METLTELVSESRKMRVSFLVLFGVIAVCNTNISAKVVKSVVEDEVNDLSQSTAQTVRKNDTTCQDSAKKSNGNDEDHIVRKREANPDLASRLDALSKRRDKKKIEPKKNKYEEQKTTTVLDKTHPAKSKYDSEIDNKRRGKLTTGNWHPPQTISKSLTLPIVFSSPWHPQNNIQATFPRQIEPDTRTLVPEDILKIGELADIFRGSFKAGLDRVFDAIENELRRKLSHSGSTSLFYRPSVYNLKTRSSCIDTGDGSCESESTNYTYDTVSPNECSDDAPTTTNDLNNGIAPDKRSNSLMESPIDFLKETLPAIVKAAESILGEVIDSKKSLVRDFGYDAPRVVADGEIYDRKTSAWDLDDEAAEAVADDGIDNTRSVSWDFGDIDE